MKIVSEVLSTITDPAAMLGPEVSDQTIDIKNEIVVVGHFVFPPWGEMSNICARTVLCLSMWRARSHSFIS